jgi:hypothetical protein
VIDSTKLKTDGHDGSLKRTIRSAWRTVRPWLRVFSADKRIDSRFLNACGLQPGRAAAAEIMRRVRSLLVRSGDPRIAALLRDGMILIEDYLPAEAFRALKVEYERALPLARVREVKGARYHNMFLSELDLADFPQMARLARDPFLREAAAANQAQRVSFADLQMHMHRVMTLPGEHDQNLDPHTDTFHATTKGWLFMHDVPVDGGPFCYAPGSHHLLNRWRLSLEYRRSLNAPEQNGSWRLSHAEMEAAGIDVRPFPVRANTLVIANTAGFHARGGCREGVTRDSIHFSCRVSPFLP